MKVFIHTTKENISDRQFFKENLEKAGFTVCEISSCMDFKKEISDSNIPDLVLLDFYSYNALHFDLYSHLEKYDFHSPVFIYNYPVTPEMSVELFWRMTFGTLNYSFFEEEKYQYAFDILFPLFERMRKEDTDSEERKTFTENADLNAFKAELSQTQLKLFSLLLEYKNKILNQEEICSLLEKNGLFWKKNTLNCNISRLNLILKEHPETELQLIKTGTGFTLADL